MASVRCYTEDMRPVAENKLTCSFLRQVSDYGPEAVQARGLRYI